MFKNLNITNFRCLGGLQLNPLERVNLIAGKNNTGKTAVLEAIYLHCKPAGCDLAVNINKARGIENPVTDVDSVCSWLFTNRAARTGLWVASQDDKGVTRTVKMWLLNGAEASERFPDQERALGMRFGMTGTGYLHEPRIVMQYEQPGEQTRTSIAVTVGSNFYWLPATIPWNVDCVFLAPGAAPEKEVEFFGRLEVAKRQDDLLPALRLLDPRVRRLSQVNLAGQPVIHADIDLPQLVPMTFMGEGMRRVLSIVLAIANASGGVVLIDEIENGFHHSVLKDIWKALAHAARKANVQVFATTHSYECINAAHEAFKASGTYDLRLHRLALVKEGIGVGTYDEETLGTAMEHFMEVR